MNRINMKKLLFLGAMLFFAWLPMMAQNSQAQTAAQAMVSNISAEVTLSATQQTELTQEATEYFQTLYALNGQYSNPAELVQAKIPVHEEFEQTLQRILTQEQYAAWQQARQQQTAKRQEH